MNLSGIAPHFSYPYPRQMSIYYGILSHMQLALVTENEKEAIWFSYSYTDWR